MRWLGGTYFGLVARAVRAQQLCSAPLTLHIALPLCCLPNAHVRPVVLYTRGQHVNYKAACCSFFKGRHPSEPRHIPLWSSFQVCANHLSADICGITRRKLIIIERLDTSLLLLLDDIVALFRNLKECQRQNTRWSYIILNIGPSAHTETELIQHFGDLVLPS